MKRRILGRTGLSVSEISLGTAEIGMDYGISVPGEPARSAAEIERLLHGALDLGINFIDTARAYGDAEEAIGRWLGERRAEFVLCTKVAAPAGEGIGAGELYRRITSSVEESLRHLRTDRADIVMIHSASREVIARGEVASVLNGLRRGGKLRYIGASTYGEQAALAAVENGDFDVIQIAYSVLDRRPESCVLEAAGSRGVGVVARSVLLKGALTHRARYLPEELAPLRQAAARLQELAGATAASLPELAYRYILSRNPPHSALVGTARLDEVQAAIGWPDKGPLPEDTIASIRALPGLEEALLNPANWPPI